MCNDNSKVRLQNGDLKLKLDMEGFSEARNARILSFITQEYINELMGLEVEVEQKEEKSAEQLIQEAYMETYRAKPNPNPLKMMTNKVEAEEAIVSDEAKAKDKEEKEKPTNSDNVSVESIAEEAVSKLDDSSYRKVGGGYTYQTYYSCPKCGNKRKAFIFRQPYVNCHDCGYRMPVKPALKDAEFPHADSWGNVYVAGFQRQEENKKDIDKIYQFKLEQEMAESKEEDKPDKLKVK